MTSTIHAEEQQAAEVFLKTDRLGRVTVPVQERELILNRFEESGLSGQAFAAQIGVKYPTFANWVQKRRRARREYANENSESVKAPLALVEAIVEKPETEPEERAHPLKLETVSGMKIVVSGSADIPLAVDLLKALRDAEL